MRNKVNLGDGLRRFDDLWKPKIIADLNDYKVQLVKVQGDWVWHTHEDTDEFFLVISGRMTIQLRDGDVDLEAGDLLVVPKGSSTIPRPPRFASSC